jgi:tetratricopeptide (TPR) repeat protein
MMDPRKSFWVTLPGIFTTLATVITAIGGLLVALANIGILDFRQHEVRFQPQKETVELNSLSPILKDQMVAKYKDSGKLHFEGGKYNDAIKDLEEALRLKPDDAWTLRYLADSYVKNKQYILALSAINHSISFDQTNAYSYKLRALIYYETSDFEKAIADFKKALVLEPDNVWSNARLADSYQALGQNELGLEYANRALRINPADAFSYKVRGRIYYNLKRSAEAMSDFQKVLEIEPNNAWSKDFLQKTKEKMK